MDNRDRTDDTEQTLDDLLGIAHAPVPRDANDIHATNDPDEVAAACACAGRVRRRIHWNAR